MDNPAENVPATKAELRTLLREELQGFATKDDLKPFATKDDLKPFATKDDLKPFATKDGLKPFATKDDLKPFATKDDLKPFATKDDLKPFATKDDLKPFATKDDLKNLATKDDLRSMQETLDEHTHLLGKNTAVVQLQGKTIADLKKKVEKIEETMATKKDVRGLISAVESVVPKGETFMQKAVTHGHILDDHEEQLRKQKADIQKHDDRITALESKGKE